MALTKANRPRFIASLALAVVVALLGLALRKPTWRPITVWRPAKISGNTTSWPVIAFRIAAEIRLGLLNIFDADYRLNPLNLHAELRRGRTVTVSLRLNF